MKRYILAVTVLASMAIMVTGCKKTTKDGDVTIVIKQSEGQVLAEVGTSKLTLEEMREGFLNSQGSFRGSANLNTDKARKDYIESQVMQEAMFKKAIETGFVDNPELKRELKKMIVQRFVRDKLETAQKNFVPTPEQIKDHYDKNQNFYNRDDAIKVAFISIPFGSDKAKTKNIAELMHKDAMTLVKNNNTREFSRIAMKHAQKLMEVSKISVETNETDYLDKAAFEAKFGANTFDALKDQSNTGDIRPLAITDNAYVIMMKTGARKAISESLEVATPKIIKRLGYEGRNDFYKKLTDDLRAEYKPKIYNELVADLSKDDKPKMATNGAPTNMQEAAAAAAAGMPAQNAGATPPATTKPAATAQQIDPSATKDEEAGQ